MSPGFQITTFIIAVLAVVLSSVALIFCIMFQQDVNQIYYDVYAPSAENDIIELTPVDE